MGGRLLPAPFFGCLFRWPMSAMGQKWKSGCPGGMSAKCHVWTAPCWQGIFGGDAGLVGAAMCPAF